MPQPRQYESSHGWLRFHLDVSENTPDIWLMLGEAYSKCQHLAGVPLTPAAARNMYNVYLAKGAHATTSIEGNTMSEAEVRERVDNRKEVPASREYLAVEVDNVLDSLQEILDAVRHQNHLPPLNTDWLCRTNERVLRGVELEDGEQAGCLRTRSVVVGGGIYRGAPAEDLQYLTDRLCAWLNDMRKQAAALPQKSDSMRFSILVTAAILAHLYIAWIHPFIDGNGRTARMVEFQILAESGLVPVPAATLLSDHYNRTRERYYRELRHSSENPRFDVVPFIRYAVEGFVDGLREQVAFVKNEQLRVTWENYVHEEFQEEPNTDATKRRRRLVLAMPHDTWVQKDDLPDLTTHLARDYAVAGPRMLARDLNVLVRMGLVLRRGRAFRADRAQILAFIPPVAQL